MATPAPVAAAVEIWKGTIKRDKKQKKKKKKKKKVVAEDACFLTQKLTDWQSDDLTAQSGSLAEGC